ncbi:MAG: sulfur oxidation c-type cytochrome SoxA [Gammaproteobacteria bacterium]|nr:sulfur oxidation c-type cytochrome SoxA [Gammaproteobacteria bacterium]MCW8840705.1 sulfur oxidation c-type cytochrome SoxA [Gammaproteobacteria bacterium]MCW8959226.1 sulfur oxidation c-type cytochrome SoxA [Gammaproteobacteria bacterium]MCW8973788.1 sulfur oxidation c-type cytochrome SoxA [Gammaproteobacteria bacterium]MCW8991607.1 sulfur oxidation c-type cytochrome SoxA [Gammaproteobacteria bacterium]
MRKIALTATAVALFAGLPLAAQATPADDLKSFREHFIKMFPGVPLEEYKNGVYAINADARSSWEAIEEFPPYEDELERGGELFNTPFANGKTYASCFPNGGKGIRQNYPYFDSASGKVKTLEQEINECRTTNGEKPLGWNKGDIAAISAYMASTSNGKKLNVKVPNDPRALEAYNRGKQFFYAKRGQLNLSCANCHYDNAGRMVRADTLSPALGHLSHFPVYRLKWNGLGTAHRRYGGCNKQVRAKPFPAQSDEYRALEYFHTYMSNGISVNAPSSRK